VRGLDRDLVVYASLQAAFTSILAALGEARIDAYVSVSILIYFVATTIQPSIRKYSDLRVLDALLIALFSLIVVFRVLEILGYRMPMVST